MSGFIVEITNFRITEAPIGDRAPRNSDKARCRSGELSRTVSGASGGQRLRMFSTFQSASRPSVSPHDSGNRIKLSEILASGVSMAMEPGEFNADSTFLKRLSRYEFRVNGGQTLRELRILFCKNLDEAVYAKQALGMPITDEIMMRPSLRVINVGDREPSPRTYEFSQEIYIPEDQSVSRRLFVFFVYGEEARLLVKARAVVMDENDQERVKYIGQHMNERDEKLRAQVERMKANTVMKLFRSEELIDLVGKTRDLPKPPFRYLLGAKNTLLAYRVFVPANRDSVVANLILLSIDATLLEYLAGTISTSHPIRVILVDLRGFGYSGGKRGHTPSRNQAYKDIGQLVRHVRGFSTKPVILGGYTFGAGLAVNYGNFSRHEKVDAYLLISPLFGRPWRSVWRQELKTMNGKDKIVTVRPAHLLLARLTSGKVGGSKYVFRMKFDEEAHEFSPMHVNKMTANYVMAYTVEKSASVFRRLAAPLGVLLAEHEEFLQTEKFKTALERVLPNHNDGETIMEIKGRTGLGMLMNGADNIAAWIKSLEIVKPWSVRAKEPVKPLISLEEVTALVGKIPNSVADSIREGVAGHIYDRVPRKTDCAQQCCVSYDLWEPSYLPGRPLGILVLLAPRLQAFAMPRLAEEHRIMVFRLDPWRFEGGSRCDVCPRKMWKFLENSIRLIKANFPGTPFFLGGVGLGASLVIGYARRPDKHPVNGYFLAAPVGDPRATANQSFSKGGGKTIDKTELLYGVVQPADTVADAAVRKTIEKAGYLPHLMGALQYGDLSKDLATEIEGLDAPSAVFLPSDHPTFRYEELEPRLAGFLKPPFKMAKLYGGDVYSMLGTAIPLLGEWLVQLSSSVAPRVPLLLGHPKMTDFEPIEMIGKGTFGKVFLVRHIDTSRFLALKVLEKETIVANKQASQVVREKEVLAECSECPFIVSYVGSFQDRRRLYLVMEFVIGGELFTHLNRVKRMPVEDARFYLAEVMVALEYMHERDIVYRDLKPENIVLDALGHVRLVDFGFARHLENGRCNSFCGSPFYIAPEMLSSQNYGKSVDIWAVGVLLFELLTGYPPFSGNTANEVYRKILFSNLEVPPSLDSESRDLLYCLLDPSPDTRLGSKNGLRDVMRHRWFKGIDWERARSKQLTPPLQPHFTFEGDTANFVKMSGASLDFEDDGGADKYENLFLNF